MVQLGKQHRLCFQTLLSCLMELSVFNGHRGLAGKVSEQIACLTVEALLSLAVNRERSIRGAVTTQRNA